MCNPLVTGTGYQNAIMPRQATKTAENAAAKIQASNSVSRTCNSVLNQQINRKKARPSALPQTPERANMV
jgi:hypothetical protein